jgi:hypothetical protein
MGSAFRRAGRLGFPLELAQAVRIEERGQHLDRDLAPQTRISGSIDLSHTSRADLAEDLVGAQLGAGTERHFRPSTR